MRYHQNINEVYLEVVGAQGTRRCWGCGCEWCFRTVASWVQWTFTWEDCGVGPQRLCFHEDLIHPPKRKKSQESYVGVKNSGSAWEGRKNWVHVSLNSCLHSRVWRPFRKAKCSQDCEARGSLTHSFFQQIFTKGLPCAQHYSRGWGHSRDTKQTKILNLSELTLWSSPPSSIVRPLKHRKHILFFYPSA